MVDVMLNVVDIAEGEAGTLLARSAAPGTPKRTLINAIPASQALARDAETLAATNLADDSGQRAACIQLSAATKSLVQVGSILRLDRDAAAVVEGDIRRIRELAEAVQTAVLGERPPGDVAALQNQIILLQTERDSLRGANRAQEVRLQELQRQLDAGAVGLREEITALEEQADIQGRRISDLQLQLQAANATITDLRAGDPGLRDELRAATQRNAQLRDENERLQERLADVTQQLAEAGPQLVAQLRRRIQDLERQLAEEAEEGPSQPPQEETPGPIADDSVAVIDNVFHHWSGGLAAKGALRTADVGEATLPAFSVRVGRAFEVPSTPGETITNLIPEPAVAVRWKRATLGYRPGSVVTIRTEARPWTGAVPAWTGYVGFMIGHYAFMRITFTSGRAPVNVVVTKENRAPLRPTAGWRSNLVTDLSYAETADPDTGELSGIFKNRMVLDTRTSGVPESEEIFAPDVYPSADTDAVRIFTDDTDWNSVVGNVTRLYVVGDDLTEVQALFDEYNTVLEQIRTRLASPDGITYDEAQRLKVAKLQNLAQRGKVHYVTDQGVIGTAATVGAELQGKQVSWADPADGWTNEDDEFKSW